MADRKLAQNVFVEYDEVGRGTWYGPDYPDNPVTAEVAKKITHPGAWEDSAVVGGGDFRLTAADFAATGDLGKDGSPPSLRAGESASADERAELERLSKDELAALAEARQVDVAKTATKAEFVEALAPAR